jgi:uncharacterized protein with WD repeat
MGCVLHKLPCSSPVVLRYNQREIIVSLKDSVLDMLRQIAVLEGYWSAHGNYLCVEFSGNIVNDNSATLYDIGMRRHSRFVVRGLENLHQIHYKLQYRRVFSDILELAQTRK